MEERQNYSAQCRDCKWFGSVPRNDDAAVRLAEYVREHTETTRHEVFVPFKMYERKGQ